MSYLRRTSMLVSIAATLLCVSASAQSHGELGESKAAAASNRLMISTTSTQLSSSSPQQVVNLQFSEGVRSETLKAFLNGRDVSSQFTVKACPGSVCLSAQLSEADGMRTGNNVISAWAKNQDGTAASSRFQFSANQSIQRAAVAHSRALTGAAAQNVGDQVLPTLSSFLPPTVALSTTQPGGVTSGANWLNLGSQIQLATFGNCANFLYSITVLDRQTLQQKSGSPENSPNCGVDGGDLTARLQSFSQGDLVIVGTFFGKTTDASTVPGQFDTSAIGGTVYNCLPSQSGQRNCGKTGLVSSPDQPLGYIAIGVVGAKSGSAYENYTTAADPLASAHLPFAQGMLLLDVNGNYNFQSTNNVEYIVNPGPTSSSITIMNAPSYANHNVIYTPPSGGNGFWLLVLDRQDLASDPSCSFTQGANNKVFVTNCGTFYGTGSSGGDPNVIGKLAADLKNVAPSELAILTTVGTAGWGNSPEFMASDNSTPNNTIPLSQAFQQLGIPDKAFLRLYAANSAYTMISSPGMGNPVSGHSVLSSTGYAAQGHSGYIHGTFARDSRGYYEPSHTEQQSANADFANVKLGLATSQAPVEWPELQQTLLPGATSAAGQADAYRYLSWYLLNGWYVQGQSPSTGAGLPEGVTGPEKYDIHYYFTGSFNTLLDYHTFDPADAQFPGTPGFSDRRSAPCTQITNGVCTWTNQNDNQVFNFTQADFGAVRTQLHNELVALNNVLNFFVTDSTNLKDVVAAGNSNSALALLQAAEEVQAGIIKPPPTTPVTVSPWHIVHMIASDVSPFISFATDGVVNPADIALASKVLGVVGDLFTSAGSIGGGLASGTQSAQAGQNEIPRLDYKLDTTIGQLASSDLQGQMLAGFDITIDTITSDWGRLQALGGGDITQTLFSPNQLAQNHAIAQLTVASQKSIYLSLIPAFYQVHYWPMAGSYPTADLGYTANGDYNSCHPFYTSLSTPFTSVRYPTYGGTTYEDEPWHTGVNQDSINPYQYDYVPPFYDWYVLAQPFVDPGTTDSNTPVMNAPLANILFGSGAGSLNFSFDEFVALNGPMDRPITGAPSTFQNGALWDSNSGLNFVKLYTSNICSVAALSSQSDLKGAPAPPPYSTSTALQAPATAVLGTDVTLQAKVTETNGSATAVGTVQFRDGSTILQNVPLDATGSATFIASGLALGQHALSAYFVPSKPELPSNSAPQSLMVYADKPDMQLSLSQPSLNVTYGVTSSPVSLQVKALSGMSGAVTYSCTGLPLGMSCAFTPGSGALAANGAATTTFTITGTAPSAASFAGGNTWAAFLLALPLCLLSVQRLRSGKLTVTLPLLSLLLIAASITGCGGSPKAPITVRDTGSKTVLVGVMSGALTRTTPLIVNVQQ